MWAHNNVIIIGESLAKEGIAPVVDFFTHNPELRMKTVVVVSRGDEKEYLAAKAGMESPPGVSFILLENYRSLVGDSVESHMLEVSSSLKNKYSNPLISVISIKKSIIQSGLSDNTKKEADTIELSGSAVFKKDKLIGWLSPEESLGVAWVINQTHDTLVTVSDPEHGSKSVSVETFGVRAKIKTRVIDGMPLISIYITGAGDIVEEDGSTNQSMSEVKEQVTKLVNQKIEDEIKSSLEVAQKKYGVDVFGFAAIVHAQNDAKWENGLKDKWDSIFPRIPVTVSADITIESSTLNQEPVNID